MCVKSMRLCLISFYLLIIYNMGYKEDLEAKTGFKFTTDVWEVFTDAETNGDVEIEELYRELFRKRHDDVKMVAELSMCLNWKIHEHGPVDEPLARRYSYLWERVHNYALDVFEWEDADYYFRVTD